MVMFKEQREEVNKFQSHFKKNQKIREYSSHINKVHSVSWSCDGKRLASGSLDKTVCLFTLSNDRLSKEHTYRGHGDSVDQVTLKEKLYDIVLFANYFIFLQLCWHPSDPDFLATASADK